MCMCVRAYVLAFVFVYLCISALPHHSTAKDATAQFLEMRKKGHIHRMELMDFKKTILNLKKN